MKSNKYNLDLINIVFMLISLVIAFNIPFRLFLFSYAVLGPLHYLTEINWLREKNYFSKANRSWAAVFVVIAVLIAVYPLYQLSGIRFGAELEGWILLLKKNGSGLLLTGFLFAIGINFIKKRRSVIILLLTCVSASFVVTNSFPESFIFVTAFLPTIIHVYLFTLIFILFGSLKTGSKMGMVSVVILACIPFIISYYPIGDIERPSMDVMNTFVKSSIMNVGAQIAKSLGGLQNGKYILLSEIGYRIQIFIAFAYTYHYLNWFSKTSVIGWRKALSTRRSMWVLAIWMFSMALYVYDFKLGLTAMFFLSVAHVVLEFPLNVFTIKGIFEVVTKKAALAKK